LNGRSHNKQDQAHDRQRRKADECGHDVILRRDREPGTRTAEPGNPNRGTLEQERRNRGTGTTTGTPELRNLEPRNHQRKPTFPRSSPPAPPPSI
jgi:hypothetical protein